MSDRGKRPGRLHNFVVDNVLLVSSGLYVQHISSAQLRARPDLSKNEVSNETFVIRFRTYPSNINLPRGRHDFSAASHILRGDLVLFANDQN